jgi:hypothetical protein
VSQQPYGRIFLTQCSQLRHTRLWSQMAECMILTNLTGIAGVNTFSIEVGRFPISLRHVIKMLFAGLYRTSYSRISRSTITDTELQIGQIILPPHGEGIPEEHDTHDARYARSFKEALPEDHVSVLQSSAWAMLTME